MNQRRTEKEKGDTIPRQYINLILVSLLFLYGCAVHYQDPQTGAEHIWGIGHMTMKATAPQQGQQAIVKGTDLLGVSVGKTNEGAHMGLGWDRTRRIEIIDENTAVSLEWPDSDFLKVRIGSPLAHASRPANPEQAQEGKK